MAKNNISFWGPLIRNLSLPSPFYHYCLTHSGKHVAWHNFWSLTWTRSKGKGCRCWLDVSFTLGDKLLCEQAILDFQGHRMHLRDCQRSAFMLLFTLKTTNRRIILHFSCRLFEQRELTRKRLFPSFCLMLMNLMQRRLKSGIKLGVFIKLPITRIIRLYLAALLFNNTWVQDNNRVKYQRKITFFLMITVT